MKRIAYRLEDFPKTEGSVQGLWLLGQVSDLRQFLNKTDKKTHDSSFSTWRRLAGSIKTRSMTQQQAAQVVFLAAYSRSGKPIIKEKLIGIKAIAVKSYCSRWLIVLSGRFASGNATDDDREIFRVLNNILDLTPTYSQLQAAIEGAKELKGKSLSLRTMQRDAKLANVKLSTAEPIPHQVLKLAIKRLIKTKS